mmetsp:Transcript_11793/g.27258  ORF Transcript_11793/g.27258 Transcript_11793/m.27258 type:complete len:242 (-) Transcript_11793:381-1106(-)
MALLFGTPVRQVSGFLEPSRGSSPSARVPVRLAEPLWGGSSRSRRVDFLSQCVQLQVLLEAGGDARQLHAQRISALAAASRDVGVDEGDEELPVLESTQLVSVFPLVGRELGSSDEECNSKDAPSLSEVLDHLAALNQLLAVAVQLREDIAAQSYKYTAHKLALLYQAINLSRLKRDAFRKRIEEHFEDVKEVTEGGHKQLPPPVVEWLDQLCADIIAKVREIPPSVPQKMGAALHFLQEE